MIEQDELKTHLATGVDAKIMQYEENALEILFLGVYYFLF